MNHSQRLIDLIHSLDRCVIAFSGGVDSAVVAMAALKALGKDECLAVTAVSPSVAQSELGTAKRVASEIGIPHRTIETQESTNPAYIRNDSQRCFHCKSELYSKLLTISQTYSDSWKILNGTNADDLGDFRPGLRAASQFDVQSPLADLKITKAIVREIAREWGLSVSEKPAAPCLASRIAYGESVTPEKLKMVESAEAFVRSLNFPELRVRLHSGNLARIEVPLCDIERIRRPEVYKTICQQLGAVGFQSVEIDPDGFQSGKLNKMLSTYEINNP